MHRWVVPHLFDLIFGLLERHLPAFLHSGEVQQSSIPMEGVDEIGKATQSDAIVFAIKLLNRRVDFEDIRECTCALQPKLLVFETLAVASMNMPCGNLHLINRTRIVRLCCKPLNALLIPTPSLVVSNRESSPDISNHSRLVFPANIRSNAWQVSSEASHGSEAREISRCRIVLFMASAFTMLRKSVSFSNSSSRIVRLDGARPFAMAFVSRSKCCSM